MRTSIFFLLLLAVACTVQSRYVTRVNEDDTVSAYETELENDGDMEAPMSRQDARVFKGLFGDMWNVIKKRTRKLAQKVIDKIDRSTKKPEVHAVQPEAMEEDNTELENSEDAQAFKSAYGARPNFEYDYEMEAPLTRRDARVFKGFFGDLWNVAKKWTRNVAHKIVKKIDKSNGVNTEGEMAAAQDDQDVQTFKSAFGDLVREANVEDEMAASKDYQDRAFKSAVGEKPSFEYDDEVEAAVTTKDGRAFKSWLGGLLKLGGALLKGVLQRRE